MKNIFLFVAAAVIMSSCSMIKGKGPKEFKGIVKYELQYEGEDLTPAQIAQMPKNVEVAIHGNMQKSTIVFPMYNITNITNPDEDMFVQLIDAGDFGKYAVQKKLSEIYTDSVNEMVKDGWTTDIQITDQSKEIAGEVARKAVVTMTKEGEEDKMFDIYFSENLGSAELNKNSIYEGINGLLLEYRQLTGPIVTIYKAVEISKGGVKELDFLIPVDFEVVTEEELMEKLGG
jgi:hypothetical protein